MIGYGSKRLLQTVPTLFIVSVVSFAILRAAPGNPAQYVAGLTATPQVLAAVSHRMGLDQPLYVQYVRWLGDALQGNFGHSYVSGRTVSSLILAKLPATIYLAVAGMVVAAVMGTIFGLVAAARPGGRVDSAISLLTSVSLAIPTFWSGILLILLFSVRLNWLPSGFMSSPSQGIGAFFSSLILPAVTLGLNYFPVFARFLRGGLLEARGQPYVRTAVSKGLDPWYTFRVYVLRNGIQPMLTSIGMVFGRLLGGVVITESVFSWPGLGSLMVTSIGNRDYAVVQASLLLAVLAVVLVNLVVDLAQAIVDPPSRLTARSMT